MIGISLLTLNLGAGGGTLTHVRGLLGALARVGELEYRVFGPASGPDLGEGLPYVHVPAHPAARSTIGRALGLASAAVAPDRVRRTLRAHDLDALHFPVGVMLPTYDDAPTATTLHDLQHEVYPQFFSRAQLAYRRRVYGRTVRASRILIADSDHARTVLLERYPVEPERVRTIHLGVDAAFAPAAREREPFLLYPANRWPHKNHARLFQAFALVRRERPELRLVLTGLGHDASPLPPGVEARGRVSRGDLVELYRTAAAVVFPSLYEGFGLPPLEAMACACPVAVSRAGPLPEICADAATYFDPTQPEDIARGITEALDRPRPGGVERAAQFSWEACARRHESVYRELAELRS